METPHDVFRQTLAVTGDRFAAIRAIRTQFGLDLRQAKEVMLQAEGTAASLNEHEQRIADAFEEAEKLGLLDSRLQDRPANGAT